MPLARVPAYAPQRAPNWHQIAGLLAIRALQLKVLHLSRRGVGAFASIIGTAIADPGRRNGGWLVQRKIDLSVYFITDPVLCAERGIVETAIAAVAGGATVVQLRDPTGKGRAMLDTARALIAALRPRGVPVIINDRIDIALASGADGAHIGQLDLPVADARALLGPNAILGLSTTNASQAAAAPVPDLDYLGCGPVYGPGVKSDANPVIGLAGLRSAVAASRLPVVAIGGIGLDTAAACVSAGAAGVAVVSAIAAASDPARAAAALRASMDEVRRQGARA